MDDSVFWVVGRAVESGKLLYRDIYFTQPPLFVLIPWSLWRLTDDILVHRLFLFAVWLLNGWLLYVALERMQRALRFVALGLFLVSAFILQSYALHTEIFVLTLFLIALVAIGRGSSAAPFMVGLTASTSLFIKPLGPLVFVPALYFVLTRSGFRLGRPILRRLAAVAVGGAIPICGVLLYLAAAGNGAEFWEQVVIDNANVGISTNVDWIGYFTLTVAPLLVPIVVVLVAVDHQLTDFEWWLTVGLFVAFLMLEILRGARHYGLFNLCLLAWMAFRAQDHVHLRTPVHRWAMGILVSVAAIFHVVTVREILRRGWVTDELAAAQSLEPLPRGSLQVFANSPPRVYMLLNDFPPAYPYLFVYDTNRDRVMWDSYQGMIAQSPPDYIAVEEQFAAVEYGTVKSTSLTDAAAVRSWIEQQGGYQRLDVGRVLGVALYQRLSPQTGGRVGAGGT